MTKKKQKKSIRSLNVKGFGTTVLTTKLSQLRALIRNNNFDEAELLALNLHQEFPTNVEVIKLLVDLYEICEEDDRKLYFLQKWAALEPDNTNLGYNLAFFYLKDQGRYAYHALYSLKYCVEQWPDHPYAENARLILQTLGTLDPNPFLDSFGLNNLPESADIFALARRCEQFIISDCADEYTEAYEKILEFITDFPQSIQLRYYLNIYLEKLGKLPEAIEGLEELIAAHPDYVEAHCELAIFYLQNNQIDRAETIAEVIATFAAETDTVAKIMQVLSRMGYDQRICELFEEIETQNAEFMESEYKRNLYAKILHLSAVSFCHLGQLDQAENLWRRALDINPSLKIAKDNLADLMLPENQRNGAWAFYLKELFSSDLIQRFYGSSVTALKTNNNDQFLSLMNNLPVDYPYLHWVCLYLIQRGSERDRLFVQSIAFLSQDSKLITSLKTLISSKKCSEEFRQDLTETFKQFDVLPLDLFTSEDSPLTEQTLNVFASEVFEDSPIPNLGED